MKANRTAQLIYQSFYCALGLVAIFASFGIFDDYTMFRWDFFVNLETQGVAGVAKWAAVLFVAFMAVGFVFYGIDRLLKCKDKR